MADITDDSLNQESQNSVKQDGSGDVTASAGIRQSSEDHSDDGIDTASQSVSANVATVKLEDELKKSFIDYAMSVIVDRALPDVRDGLKPVHRRVLYDMYDLKIWHNGQTKKSARVVGDVIGRFHPHGDAAVYETIVRMAQWFSMRAPLIFGQGNFGNIDGDGPAAMRYTEVRMTKIAEMMLQDIDKETVDTYPNYDGNEQIPEVLPTRFPNLLVNGSSGIAVGMATNIPPHNLGEVIDGTVALLDNPDLGLDDLMRYIPGPDFPTGGFIVGNAGIREAYRTGRGRCIMRARTHIEEDKSGRKTIYVDEIPYVVNKSAIVKQIAELVRDKKIEGISEVNDLSDKDNQVRIAIDLKRDAYEEAVLNNLFERTSLQSSFPINMIALVHNHPRQLPLKEILSEFINFRREVVTRRTVYLLRQDRRKAFLDEGLIVAKANINKIVDMITDSANADEARRRLMEEPWDGTLISSLIERTEEGFNICLPSGIDPKAGLHDDKYYLSEEQARAILALQLQRLTHLAGDEIQADYKALIENIKGYLEILNNPVRMNEVIRGELIEVKEAFADKRRSDFTEDYGKLSKADFIAPQDVIVTLSQEGYIKYQDISTYEAQQRGGKGRQAAKLKDDDFISRMAVTNTHDTLMCFTDKGRVFASKVFDLPTSENRTWRGRPIQNIFKIEEGEKITALLPVSEFDENHFIIMATVMGYIKKVKLSAFKSFMQRVNDQAIKAITLREGDSLMGAEISSGDDDVFVFSSDGQCIRICEFYNKKDVADNDESDDDGAEPEVEENEDQFSEGEVKVVDRHAGQGIRPSGRGSGALRIIKLRPGQTAVSLILLSVDETDPEAVMVTANGYGKRILLTDIPLRMNRGSSGVKTMSHMDRNGKLVGVVRSDINSDYLVITDLGHMTRTPVSNLPLPGRTAGGVIVMRPYEGESIIALQSIPENVVASNEHTRNARNLDKNDELEIIEKLNGGKDKDAEETSKEDI